jgi:hypothetical protein
MHKRILNQIFFYILVAFTSYLGGELFLSSITKLDISDFHVYYYVPKMIFDADSPTHPYVSYIPIYPYFFPPPSIPILYLISFIPFYLAKILWTFLNFGFLVGSIYLILKSLKKFNWLLFFLLLLISFIYHPIVFTLQDGQFNLILLFIFSVGLNYFETKKQILSTSFLIALGIVSKISPGILLFYALLKKNFKLIIYSGLISLILLLISEITIAYKINYYYFKTVVSQVSQQSNGFGLREQSTLALVKRINSEIADGFPRIYESIILYSLVAFFISLFVYLEIKKSQSKFNNYINISLLCFISVTGTGLTWFHQYSILFLPIVVMLLVSIFHLRKFRAYFIISYSLVLFLWTWDLFAFFTYTGWMELYMYWAGWLFLINTFILKANQKFLEDESLVFLESIKFPPPKYLFITILFFFLAGIQIFSLDENLKRARDFTRVKEINFMSKILVKHSVRFNVGEANSYKSSNRADRGYILLLKEDFNKIIHEMRVLYIDTINNETFHYRFKSTNGSDFELSAKLESQEYISKYGDFYIVKSLNFQN